MGSNELPDPQVEARLAWERRARVNLRREDRVSLTWGELRDMAEEAGVPDETLMVTASRDWWKNVDGAIWDPDDGILGFTLFPGEDVDTRQW